MLCGSLGGRGVWGRMDAYICAAESLWPVLETIITKFGGGPVGLETLSAATGEDMRTIEDVYEPYFIQLGFINKTPRGRMATPAAYKHLGIPLENEW